MIYITKTKRLQRIGNSFGLIIPKGWLYSVNTIDFNIGVNEDGFLILEPVKKQNETDNERNL